MRKTLDAIGRRFMSTESEWNPKVALGRAVTALLPERAVHLLKKKYYGYLLSHQPDSWREKDARVVGHLVGSGDRVIDIGASIGEYTRYLSQLVGPSGHVYSFEPNPPIYQYLSHNVRKLKLPNVHLYDSALSDRQGRASIVIPRYRWGSECHYDATLETGWAGSDCRRVEVRVNTLDSFFVDSGEAISFLKCDVNYHELACLRGGLQILRRSKPAILIEILPDPDQGGSQAAQVFELLGQNGYLPYWFDGQRLQERKRGERNQNYFFLTREHLTRLPAGLYWDDRDESTPGRSDN